MAKFKDFIEWPTQEEAPLRISPIQKPNPKERIRVPVAPTTSIFMAQSLDHGLSYILCALFLGLALSLFQGLVGPQFFGGLGFSFWLGLSGFVFLIGLLHRILGFVFVGSTVGAYYMKLQVFISQPTFTRLLLIYAWEALEGAIPGLWFLSTILRLSEARPGVSYIYRNL